MLIAITGGTGFIGTKLLEHLAQRGDRVHLLTRNPQTVPSMPAVKEVFKWGGESVAAPREAFEGVDAVIHLAGKSIAGRFTEKHKEAVYNSRIEGTRRIVEAIAGCTRKPRVLVSSSGVNYYGDRGDAVLTVESEAGDSFISRVCVDWEREARKASEYGVQVKCIRTGIVLGKGGGALQEMLTPFKAGVGGPFGNGRAWWSWIHLDDICRLYLHALEKHESTTYNGTAPNPVTNREFARTLGKVLHRPAILPLPRSLLRLALGEMADNLLLQSVRAVPANAQREGFSFKYPLLEEALRNVLHK